MAKIEKPEIFAAGTVLTRIVGSKREVCLVHRPAHHDWSLPKGKLDPGEHAVAAAWRETAEETGEHVCLGMPLPAQFYQAEGKLKRVDYWLARTVAGGPGFQPNREIDKLGWFTPPQAAEKLTYPRDRDLLRSALRLPVSSPLVLLRHSQALRRVQWGKRSDMLRPLTPAGKANAKKLAKVLAAFGVRVVHSSDAVRCLDTVGPYSRLAGLKTVPEAALSELGFEKDTHAGVTRMAQLLKIETPLVLCTHRPLLPKLVERLREELGVKRAAKLDPALPPGGFLVLHRRFVAGGVKLAAVERHEC